jgi:hypothetical protein
MASSAELDAVCLLPPSSFLLLHALRDNFAPKQRFHSKRARSASCFDWFSHVILQSMLAKTPLSLANALAGGERFRSLKLAEA